MTSLATAADAASALLIPCEACGKPISVDSIACPSCGRLNEWVHPKIAQIVDHLRMHYPDTVYERRGHQIAIEIKTYSFRQQFGSACLAFSMLFVIAGLFIPFFMGLAILLLALGGCLVGFGLSAFTRHAIQIDIRLPNPVIAVSDAGVWASVIGLIR